MMLIANCTNLVNAAQVDKPTRVLLDVFGIYFS